MEGISWGQCGEKGLWASLSKPAFKKPPCCVFTVFDDADHELPSCLFHFPDTDELDEKLVPHFSVSQLYNVHECHCGKKKDKPSKCLRILRDLKWSLRNCRKPLKADLLVRKWWRTWPYYRPGQCQNDRAAWIKEEPPRMETGTLSLWWTRVEKMRPRCRKTALRSMARCWRPNYQDIAFKRGKDLSGWVQDQENIL